MSDKLKTWLEEQSEQLSDSRNKLEIDRLVWQGRQEAIAAVLGQIEEISNEDTKSEGETAEVAPTTATN